MTQKQNDAGMSFWEHLDVLRDTLIKIIIATALAGVAAFFFKDELFALLLAPKYDDFITYRVLGDVSPHSVRLINTDLSEQFMIHMKMSLYAGFFLILPYVLYMIFHFVAPALYENERRNSIRMITGGYVMFIIGTLVNYFVVFPLTFRFLGTYQVSTEVENMISLHSYIDTLVSMTFTIGVVFEIPVLCWLLAKTGVLTSDFMKRFRRHSIVIILILAAIITPTSDVFTMLLVALPVWMLYEISIIIVRNTNK